MEISHGTPGWNEFVARFPQRIVYGHFRDGKQILKMLRRFRADQRSGDARLVLAPQNSQMTYSPLPGHMLTSYAVKGIVQTFLSGFGLGLQGHFDCFGCAKFSYIERKVAKKAGPYKAFTGKTQAIA